MENSRTTMVSLVYNGKNLSKKLKNVLENFRYTDVASGESDSIEFTLNNRSLLFCTKYMPRKGDQMTASIFRKNWTYNGSKQELKCGSFVLDDLSFEEPPLTCTVGGVAMPVKGEFKTTKRSKVYKKTTVKEIASQVAKRAGVSLYYDAPAIHITKLEQSKSEDSSFLASLCEEYGLGLKIYKNKLVIFDEEAYEQKAVAKTIKRCGGHVKSWTWNTTLQGTYTGAKVVYTDADNTKKHHMTIGEKGRMYRAEVSAFSKMDAARKARALLANENKKRTTMTLELYGILLYAGATVKIEGFGKMSGKYYVDQVVHSVGSSGYTQSVTLHKVSPRVGLNITEFYTTTIKKKTKKKTTSKNNSTSNKNDKTDESSKTDGKKDS